MEQAFSSGPGGLAPVPSGEVLLRERLLVEFLVDFYEILGASL
jgi:hypothetical protein